MARRHKALESICHSEEQIRQLRGVQEALGELAGKCLSLFDGSLAIMAVPSKGIWIRSENPDQPLTRGVRLVHTLETDLPGWLKTVGDRVLINDGSQETPRKVETGTPCKVAVAPIIGHSGGADGLLVIARHPDAQDFRKRDVEHLVAIAENIAKIVQANYDSLTGLINRNELEHLMTLALAGEDSESATHCVLHLNIDNLQSIFESSGREAHEEAIRQVAMQLECQLNEVGPVSRIGEDEFGILVVNCPQDLGWFIGEGIRRGISGLDIVWNGQPIKLTASIGVAKLARDSETVESALAAAKIACIAAKDRGRDRVAMYRHHDALLLNGQPRARVIQNIQKALRDDQFVLYCQPIKSLTTRRKASHFEILIRGLDENTDPVPPGKFMSHAEHARLMPEIDRWVVRNTLRTLNDHFGHKKNITGLFAINLSGQSICDDSFMDFVIAEIGRANIPPESICFEITETAAILNIKRATEFMTAMRKRGCLFALDDFGAGLSSFAYLKTLPLDYLKIDGQFIREILNDPVSSSIVSAITQMGHAMGLKTIAEFVNGDATKRLLKRLGVDYAQGFGIAKPLPLDKQLEALSAGPRRPTSKTSRVETG